MQEKTKGMILLAITATLWSFGGMLIKLIKWDAMTIIGMRAIFAAIVFAVYMKRPVINLSLSVVLGAICMSGTTILFVFANKLTSAANAIVLQYSAPIFVIILSFLLLRRRPRRIDVISVLAVFAGIALFFIEHLHGSAALGNILACLSGITFAGVFLINQMPDSRPEQALLLGHLINIIIGLPFILTNITFEPIAWISIIILGIFQLGLAYVLFSIGIKLTTPISASLIASIEPLLNPIWVFIVLGDKPGMWALIGGALVLGTVTIYNIVMIKNN